jgi:ketosteroid isomerase-like protein
MPTPTARTARQPGRDPIDQLLVRVPKLANYLAARLVQIRRSPLRARLVRLQLTRGFAAMARSDVEVVLLFYDPNAEVWMRSMTGVGLSDCYRGHPGIRALYADLDDAFIEWKWTIGSVVDRGDRLAIQTDFAGRGRGSGARTEVANGGTVVRLSPRGLVTWQEWFVEREGWEKAIEALDLAGEGTSA